MTDDVVHVDRVTAGYGDRVILEDVSMRVRRGRVHVLMGTSGCGKSTLLKSIIGLMRPIRGTITVLGEDTADTENQDGATLLSRVGVLFQAGALLGSLNLHDNVALPLREHTELPESAIDEIVGSMLAIVGLSAAQRLLPSELSGGMRKRAALARALALGPDLLLCDEPSAGLDPVTAAGLDDLITSLRDRFGTTILVITHELASISAIADDATMLHAGQVVADGTLRELQNDRTPEVRAFFNRVPPVRPAVGSMLATLTGEGGP